MAPSRSGQRPNPKRSGQRPNLPGVDRDGSCEAFDVFQSGDAEQFQATGISGLYQAKWGMKEHVALLAERQMPVPPINSDPKVAIQNVERLAVA
jgi:hypothetical protein